MIISFPARIPDSAELLAVAQDAHARGLYIIHRGNGDVRISPVIPPGWFRLGVSVKPQRQTPNAGALEVAA